MQVSDGEEAIQNVVPYEGLLVFCHTSVFSVVAEGKIYQNFDFL